MTTVYEFFAAGCIHVWGTIARAAVHRKGERFLLVRLWLAVVTIGLGLSHAHAQGQVNGASFVSLSVPSSMTAGQQYDVAVTMQNSGTTTWSAGSSHRLGSQSPRDNATWGFSRALLSAAVQPGQQYTFNFRITAPTASGTYSSQWMMLQEYIEWFGAPTNNVMVFVSEAPPVDAATFISQSVATSMAAKGSYSVSITMKNSGNTTWTSSKAYKLGAQNPADNFTWGDARVELGSSVAPGQQYTFTFNATAPSNAGTYNFQWRMVREFVSWFGTTSPNVPIAVGGGATGEKITYFHNDIAGTPILATNESGTVVWKENYRPYGDRINNQPASINNKLWFAGRPFDVSTGLSYMGSRYYDPYLGRFVGVDAAPFDPSNLHSFNRYAYANNNPYKFVDPDGHSPIDVVFLAYDIGKLGIAVYSGVGVGHAALDVAISVVGVGSPIPGTGQAIKAARAAEHSIQAYKAGGTAREIKTGKELVEKYGEAAVQREQFLRTADGKIAKDVLTGEGRRIDHVVIQNKTAIESVETTSMTASKRAQEAKENRIRDNRGTFVRDRQTKELVDFEAIRTSLKRLQSN
jgi:RHS repeat-associated protein